jgi:hypothetical protein
MWKNNKNVKPHNTQDKLQMRTTQSPPPLFKNEINQLALRKSRKVNM